jgi:ABC-2 type transport system ATP-binding protein
MAQLSGGYQRRLALAAAVLPGPDLLLLDEPTVGLDPVATREVHTYLRAIMAGRTTLLCTHNLAEAEALCDSVVILRRGRVLLHDRMDALRNSALTQIELAATQGPQRLIQELAGLGYTPHTSNQEVRIAVADPQRDVPRVLRELLAAGLDVYECHAHRPSLEDLFLEIVGGAHAHT